MCLLVQAPSLFAAPVSYEDSGPLKIGALLCLSGPCASWGAAGLNGMLMAAGEINANGGVNGRQIKIIVQDSKEEFGAGAVQAYTYLRDVERISYIIGPSWTPAALAIAPIAAADQSVLMISPSAGVRDFAAAGDNLFNMWPADETATRRIAAYALSKGWKRAAIFGSTQPWSALQAKTFAESFVAGGGSIVARVDPEDEQKELKTEAIRIASAKPDFVLYAGFATMGIFARELKKLGYHGGQIAVLVSNSQIENSQGALEGVLFAQYHPAGDAFTAKYIERYGEKPENSADTSYDAVYIISRALKLEGEDSMPDKIRKSTPFDGASGRVVFDEAGGVVRDPILFRLEQGKYVEVSELKGTLPE